MKKVMTRAWAIARAGAEKFGGSSKQYIQEAMVMAWDEYRDYQASQTDAHGYLHHNKSTSGEFNFIILNKTEGMSIWAVDRIQSLTEDFKRRAQSSTPATQEFIRQDLHVPAGLYMFHHSVEEIEIRENNQFVRRIKIA